MDQEYVPKTMIELKQFLNGFTDEQLQRNYCVVLQDGSSVYFEPNVFDEDYYATEDGMAPKSVIEEYPEDYENVDLTKPYKLKGDPRFDEPF